MGCLGKTKWSVFFPATALLAIVQGLSMHAESSPADRYENDVAAIMRGGAIFKSVCSGYCHQTTPTPGDALFLFDCTWKHGGSDQEIFHTISKGVPDTRMIGFAANLPEGYEDTWRIIAWLRANSQCGDPNP